MVNGKAETDESESLLPDRTAAGLLKVKGFLTRNRRRGQEKRRGEEECEECNFTDGE